MLRRLRFLRHSRCSPAFVLAAGLTLLAGCTGNHVDVGHYRIATVSDGMLGLGCQPRTEFYRITPGRPDAAAEYLGTCGTPRFVTDSIGLPGDPSCFALAPGGTALVFMHRPEWCGAGERAQAKPGGVYRDDPQIGDTLLYSDAQVGQVWSANPVPPGAMRVTWQSSIPSRGGARCAQRLLIHADGSETPEGEPHTVHGCRHGTAPAAP